MSGIRTRRSRQGHCHATSVSAPQSSSSSRCRRHLRPAQRLRTRRGRRGWLSKNSRLLGCLHIPRRSRRAIAHATSVDAPIVLVIADAIGIFVRSATTARQMSWLPSQSCFWVSAHPPRRSRGRYTTGVGSPTACRHDSICLSASKAAAPPKRRVITQSPSDVRTAALVDHQGRSHAARRVLRHRSRHQMPSESTSATRTAALPKRQADFIAIAVAFNDVRTPLVDPRACGCRKREFSDTRSRHHMPSESTSAHKDRRTLPKRQADFHRIAVAFNDVRTAL